MTDGSPASAAAPSAQVAGDLATLAAIEADLQSVDAALVRLNEGTYGTCASCGRAIEAGRLAADALTSRCSTCEPGQLRAPDL